MPIRVICACGKAYHFKDEFAGRRAKCPACGGIVVVCSTEGPEARPAKSAQTETLNQAKQSEIRKPSSVEGVASPGIGTPAAPRPSRSGKRRVLAVGVLAAVICVIVVATIVLLSWTQKATPRRAVIGHWQDVGTKSMADNPNYISTMDDKGGCQLYVSVAEAWRAEPGQMPVRVTYDVVEENLQEFWLDMRVTTGDGTTVFSRVSFSPDRQTMFVTTRHDLGRGLPSDMALAVRSQIGGSTSTTTYKRIDDRTKPVPDSALHDTRHSEARRGDGSDRGAAREDWKRYFPLVVGSEWQYDVTVQSATSRRQKKVCRVTDTQSVNGVICFALEHTTNGERTLTEYLEIGDSELLVRKREKPDGSIFLSQHEVRLKFPLVTGGTWECEGEFPGVGNLTMKYVVAGEEVVEVPAGKFKAIKVATTGYKTGELLLKEWEGPNFKVEIKPVLERTMWLTKDVGLVQETLKVMAVDGDILITSTLTGYSLGK